MHRRSAVESKDLAVDYSCCGEIWREMIPEVMAEHERVVRVSPREEVLEEGGVVGARLQREREIEKWKCDVKYSSLQFNSSKGYVR